jgi:L-fuconate dehydratase
MLEEGFPTYSTSAGWLGFSDAELRRRCKDGTEKGWNHFKIKVGGNIEDDVRRASIVREMIGYDRCLMMDAN